MDLKAELAKIGAIRGNGIVPTIGRTIAQVLAPPAPVVTPPPPVVVVEVPPIASEPAQKTVTEGEMKETILAIVRPFLRTSKARFQRIEELASAARRVNEALVLEVTQLKAELSDYEAVLSELEASIGAPEEV